MGESGIGPEGRGGGENMTGSGSGSGMEVVRAVAYADDG